MQAAQLSAISGALALPAKMAAAQIKKELIYSACLFAALSVRFVRAVALAVG